MIVMLLHLWINLIGTLFFTTSLKVIWAQATDQSHCMQSLLLNRHRIPATAFTATSEQTDPTGGRRYSADSVRAENTDYAWCPSQRVGSELEEFVQVDMGELNVVTKLVTSGLLAESGGYRFSPYFYVRYKREWSEPEWRTYRKFYPVPTSQLVGSNEPVVPKFVVLNPPLVARWIRFYPYRADTPGVVCIRLEAYGCRFTDDLVEYQIPEGSVSTTPYQAPPVPATSIKRDPSSTDNGTHYYQAGGGSAFSDISYDGYRVEPGSLLDGGLGCLTDLVIASQSTTPVPWSTTSTSSAAHLFVGWHRNRWIGSQRAGRNGEDVVDMRFRFVSVRRFQQLKMFVSNNYMEKIRLPRRVEVRFSVGGVQFSGQPAISQDFLPDNGTTGVMSIELNLENRIGQFVQLKVFFADDWLLLTEIKFLSQTSTESILPEDLHVTKNTAMHLTTAETPSSSTPSGSTELAAELFDFSGRLWPTVIILAVLIAIFLGIIGFTCARLCWKRNYWQTAAKPRNPYQTSGHPIVTDSLLNTSSPNHILFNPDGTLLKTTPFTCPETLNPSRTATRVPSVGTIPNRYPNQSEHSPESNSAMLKTAGSIYPPSDHVSGRSISNRIVNALCPRLHTKSQSQSPTGTPYSDSGTQHSRSRSVTDADSQGHVQPYSTVGPGMDGRNGPVGNLAQVDNGLLKFDFFSPRLSQPINPNGSVVPDVNPDWLIRSNTSASNSTGASFCPLVSNTEVNLYTSVGGESDADSNGASTMSPEYASTNPCWASTLMHHHQPMQQRTPFIPANSAATATGLATLSPRQLVNPITFNGLNNGPYHPSAFVQPFVYFNPSVPGLVSKDADSASFYNQVSFPAVSTMPTVYFSPTFATTLAHAAPSMRPLHSTAQPPSGWMHTMRGDVPQHMGRGSPTMQNMICRTVGSSGPHPKHTPDSDTGPWVKVNRLELSEDSSENSFPPLPPSSPPPPPPPPIAASRPKLPITPINR